MRRPQKVNQLKVQLLLESVLVRARGSRNCGNDTIASRENGNEPIDSREESQDLQPIMLHAILSWKRIESFFYAEWHDISYAFTSQYFEYILTAAVSSLLGF